MRIFVLLLTLYIFGISGAALGQEDWERTDRPLIVGPQYPLTFLKSRFEPDSGFNLPTGGFLANFTYIANNTYEFSDNSAKNGNSDGEASAFTDIDSKGLSVYFDGETHQRIAHFALGVTDWLEVQFAARDIWFTGGSLDFTVEQFHKSFGIDNPERPNTERDLFEIYVYDNEKKELVFKFTNPRSGFNQESYTAGVKLQLARTETEGLSLRLRSNFGDKYLENEINEIDTSDDTSHRDFNDFNWSINYSTRFSLGSFHAAFSQTIMEDPIFDKGRKTFNYAFFGFNLFLGPNVDAIFQYLLYTSIFPDLEGDDTGGGKSVGQDVNEITAGLRVRFANWVSMEFGAVENYTQGPHNMDIAFFGSILINI